MSIVSKCPRCNSEVRAMAKFCRACGAPLPPISEESRLDTQPQAPISSTIRDVKPPSPPSSSDRSPTPEVTARFLAPTPAAAPAVPRSATIPGERISSTRRRALRALTALVGRHLRILISIVVVGVLLAGGIFYYLHGGPLPWRSTTVSPEVRDTVQRGVILASQGQYEKAIVEFSQAILVAPFYSVAYSNRGVVYMQRREYVKALDDLRKAVQLNPRDAMAHYNVAALYAIQGEKRLAIDALTRAFENGFKDVEVLRRDPDFAKLRGDTGYVQLIDRFSKR